MRNRMWSKEQYKDVSGRVLGTNSEIYTQAVEGLRDFRALPTSDKDTKLKELVDIFAEHKASGANAVSPMPTKVMGAMVARMENQILADTIAEQVCAIDTVAPGETIHYKTKTRDTITIYKIGEMGGKPVELRYGGKESNTSLGDPVTYTTADFAVPIFDMYHPRRYMEEIEDLAVWAGMDLTDTIDTDIVTVLDTMYATTWTQASVFNYVNSRVQDIPAGNDLNISAETDSADHFTLDGFKTLLLHGQRMGRTLRQIWIPTLIKKDVWNWAHLVASSQGFTNLSAELARELETTGGSVIQLFGEPPVRINTWNILDGDAANVYGRALYEPTATYNRVAPRGACLLYWQAVDNAALDDMLIYVSRGRGVGGGIVDFYALRKACLIAGLNYQKPNWARFQIISA